MVAHIMADKPMPGQNPFGIGINNENGLFKGIKEYGISGLRSNAFNGKQLVTQRTYAGGPHFFEVSIELSKQKMNKTLQPFGFNIVISRWSYLPGRRQPDTKGKQRKSPGKNRPGRLYYSGKTTFPVRDSHRRSYLQGW